MFQRSLQVFRLWSNWSQLHKVSAAVWITGDSRCWDLWKVFLHLASHNCSLFIYFPVCKVSWTWFSSLDQPQLRLSKRIYKVAQLKCRITRHKWISSSLWSRRDKSLLQSALGLRQIFFVCYFWHLYVNNRASQEKNWVFRIWSFETFGCTLSLSQGRKSNSGAFSYLFAEALFSTCFQKHLSKRPSE